MKRFKISILMILFVMILAVSAVSAADIDDSSDADILAVDEAIEEVAAVDDVDEIQKSTDTEEVVADGEPGNFSDLSFDIESATGYTIYKDYVRAEGDSEITIDHDVSINGQGKYTIDGNNKGAIFKVNAGNTLTLRDLTIKNGHAFDGGAISNYGTLIIENCKFIDNKADQYGGAIYTYNCGDITISDSEFINNQAFDAGVIKFYGQNLVITNTKFENNTASEANGVIDFWSDNGNLTIEKSVFNNNSAAYYGAVDYRYGRTCTIANTNFTNNQAFDTESGASGALYFEDGYNLIITDSNFIDNAAAVVYGAIYFSGLYMSVEGSNFTNNTAPRYGGILVNKHKDVPTTVDIKDSKFESNGNMAVVLNNVKSEISKTEFIGNEAENNGSAILIASGEAKITESKFENNSHVAVYNNGILSVSNNTFDTAAGIVSETPVIKPGSKVTIDPIANVTYGSPIEITYDIDNKTDNVAISVTDVNDPNKKIEFNTTVDKKITVVTVLPVGTYKVSIKNPESDNYAESEDELTFNVVKADANLQVNAKINEMGIVVIEANVDSKATGNITFKVINETGVVVLESSEEIINGTATFAENTVLPKGNYNYTVEYESDNYNKSSYASQTPLEVFKSTPKLDVYSITVNEFGHIIILANVTKDAKGNVTFLFTIGDKKQSVNVDVDNGTVKYDDVAPLGKGHYGITVTYNGDTNYYSVDSINETEVDKEQINSTYEVVVTGNQAVITVKFPANATQNLTVFYPSKTNKTIPINGTVVIDEIFENGNQSILLTYPGDDKYYGFDNYKIEFFVKSTSFISSKDVSVVYQNNGKVTVTLTNNDDGKGNNPIVGATVTVTVNGKKYTAKTNAKGIATISVPAKLVPKTYKATVSYDGNATCIGDSATINFKVTKAKAKIVAKKKTFKAKKKTKKYTITLKDNKGKAIKKVKVTIKIGKKTFKAKTNKKGKATFKIKKLTKKGTYKVKITFKGNKYFKKVTKKVKIKVKK